ncbi:hypothetical protein [Gloeocapsa sp. PCC 73106]|uniref:hypothetical protein n=1 Tax=Gloeocapsa sp. PCC 73106 TaxID=102232 RepID=UPI0002ABA611|nr:hypothetical protein [Gloeocapsa sp. PCC 73106]ELR98717.1 hypothetical protein GLO73106DRAFT_00025550 [Gloeocapsa sp. PCC 73106]
MSKRDNFAGGFVIGTVVGGLVGAVVGIIVGSRSNETRDEKENQPLDSYGQSKLQSDTDFSDGLEAKISQLNLAVDEVRQKLNLVDANKSDEDHL